MFNYFIKFANYQANEAMERAKRDDEEVTELRRKLIHKANKVGEYKIQEYK